VPDVVRRSYWGRLTHAEEQVLLYGPIDSPDVFPDKAEQKAAWQHNRERLMGHCPEGRRPAAWWEFEGPPGVVCAFDRQSSTLYEAGLLGAVERDVLMAEWRAAFEHVLNSTMSKAQRLKHLLWVDMPPSLFDRWLAEESAALGLKRKAPARKTRRREQNEVHDGALGGPCCATAEIDR
jgi:hypothetical protein